MDYTNTIILQIPDTYEYDRFLKLPVDHGSHVFQSEPWGPFPAYIRLNPTGERVVGKQSAINDCDQEFQDYYYIYGITIDQFLGFKNPPPYEYW